MRAPIYRDYNAMTTLAPEVAAAMQRFLSQAYGNCSGLHWPGIPARDAVERARSQVAGLLSCDAPQVVFTSGGTEANNQALERLFSSQRTASPRPHIITSQVLVVSSAQAAEHTKDSLGAVRKNVAAKIAVLVDVRETSEWDKGHLKDSVLLPLSALKKGIDEEQLKEKLREGKFVYTFCVVGKRAVTAGRIL
jgi:selenocysteine lyase/cysteine desulfurase